MEFFPGAFETEWERRRAMLVHEMQLGRIDSYDWDEPNRGGVRGRWTRVHVAWGSRGNRARA